MRRCILIVFAAVVSFSLASAARAGDYTPEQIRAAQEFAFNDVRLGMPRADFLRRYPGAAYDRDNSDLQAGMQEYVVRLDEGRFLGCHFFGERLYQLIIVYPGDVVTRMGGEEVPLLKLVERFGRPDQVSKNDVAWRVDAANRVIVYSRRLGTHGAATVGITDLTANAALKKKRMANAKVGF